MKKTVKLSRMTLHRETLHRLDANDLRPVAGGYTGPDSHCTTHLTCPTTPFTVCHTCRTQTC